MKKLVFFVLVVIAFTGCTSPEHYARERSDQLLEIYPPGKTTRADVQKKWENTLPDFSVVRPADGWSSLPDKYIAERILFVEKKSQKTVSRCERYRGPDGLFSLCYCWFYYDAEDKLIDAEWQYMSD